jgi:hypothetical protein
LRPNTNLVTFTTYNYTSTTQSNTIYSNSSSFHLERRDSDFTLLLAICLTIAAVFIIAIIIIVFYRVFLNKRSNKFSPPSSAAISIDEYKI